MKHFKFVVPIYDIDVYLVQIEKGDSYAVYSTLCKLNETDCNRIRQRSIERASDFSIERFSAKLDAMIYDVCKE